MEALLQTIVSGMLLGGLYIIIAVGLIFIFGTMETLNFFHGQAVILGCYVAYWMWRLLGWDPYLAMPAIAAIFGMIGLGLFFTLIKPLIGRREYSQQTLLITFGAMMVADNLIREVWLPDTRSVKTPYSTSTIPVGDALLISVPRLAATVVTIIILILLWFFLTRTTLGKAHRATSQDLGSARLVGIDYLKIYALTFAVATAMAGVSGAMISVMLPFYPGFGFSLLLKGFCVILVGGMGSIPGAIISGLGLGVTENVAAYLVSGRVRDGVAFVAILTALLIRAHRRS